MSSAIRNDIETEAAEQKPRPSAGLWEWSRQCKVQPDDVRKILMGNIWYELATPDKRSNTLTDIHLQKKIFLVEYETPTREKLYLCARSFHKHDREYPIQPGYFFQVTALGESKRHLVATAAVQARWNVHALTRSFPAFRGRGPA
ncbi:hypothetical protein RRG08_012755 [Elysia crispata]|uniref:Uncharacterized protein n=1 Tax=Elysia crispata TaxID=231223 RepID=A0AAE1E175_9GAST|nr:hypothetical protein RRG08_012755 [Elysia crispata]